MFKLDQNFSHFTKCNFLSLFQLLGFMFSNSEILKSLKLSLKAKFANQILDVILFGSRSTNTGDVNSDYDILIIFNGDVNSEIEKEILNISFFESLKFDIVIDLHILTSLELNSARANQRIFINALENRVYA